MKPRLRALISRVPWRVLAALLVGAIVLDGVERLLSVDLSAGYEELARVAKLGIGMVVVGGVAFIGLILSR